MCEARLKFFIMVMVAMCLVAPAPSCAMGVDDASAVTLVQVVTLSSEGMILLQRGSRANQAMRSLNQNICKSFTRSLTAVAVAMYIITSKLCFGDGLCRNEYGSWIASSRCIGLACASVISVMVGAMGLMCLCAMSQRCQRQ